MENNPYLSIIVPVYYGSKTITKLILKIEEVVAPVLSKSGGYEVVLVNDGSKDSSDQVCADLAYKYKQVVKYFDLAKNFSEHNAVIAGLNHCSGEYAVIIDDDFQNPPSEILKLLKKIESTDSDVVFARYQVKKHNWFRNFGSRFNDWVANIMLNKPTDLYLCSFKIIKKRLIKEVIKYKGPFPYIDGLILRSTHHIETELVEHNEREEGKSNYTLGKLLALWSNLFINFSIKPLRWSLICGFIFSIVGFLLATSFIIERLYHPEIPIGWASVMVSTLIFSGVQLIVLGVVGEYLGRTYLGATNTPQYVVRKRIVDGKLSD